MTKNEFTEKVKLTVELYENFISLSAEQKKEVLEVIKAEIPQLYPALKRIAEGAEA